MGKFVTVSSLLMGAVLILCNWFFPGSVFTWFTATEQQFLLARSLIIVLVLALLLAESLSYLDKPFMRRLSGLVGASLLFGALHFGLDYPVYVLDILFVLSAGVSFTLVAVRPVITEETGLVLAAVPARPPRNEPAGLFERLRQYQPRRHSLFPAAYIDDLEDESHRLTVNAPHLFGT